MTPGTSASRLIRCGGDDDAPGRSGPVCTSTSTRPPATGGLCRGACVLVALRVNGGDQRPRPAPTASSRSESRPNTKPATTCRSPARSLSSRRPSSGLGRPAMSSRTPASAGRTSRGVGSPVDHLSRERAGRAFSWALVWKFSRFARNMEEGLVDRALLRKRGHRHPRLQGAGARRPTRVVRSRTSSWRSTSSMRRPRQPTCSGRRRSWPGSASRWAAPARRPPARAGRDRRAVRRDAADPRALGARPGDGPQGGPGVPDAAEGVIDDEIVVASRIAKQVQPATILANPDLSRRSRLQS